MAVAYSVMQFQKTLEDQDSRSFLWDLNNSSKPELELQPASQLCCLQFNPKDDHVIGAGQYNGETSFLIYLKTFFVSERDPFNSLFFL